MRRRRPSIRGIALSAGAVACLVATGLPWAVDSSWRCGWVCYTPLSPGDVTGEVFPGSVHHGGHSGWSMFPVLAGLLVVTAGAALLAAWRPSRRWGPVTAGAAATGVVWVALLSFGVGFPDGLALSPPRPGVPRVWPAHIGLGLWTAAAGCLVVLAASASALRRRDPIRVGGVDANPLSASPAPR